MNILSFIFSFGQMSSCVLSNRVPSSHSEKVDALAQKCFYVIKGDSFYSRKELKNLSPRVDKVLEVFYYSKEKQGTLNFSADKCLLDVLEQQLVVKGLSISDIGRLGPCIKNMTGEERRALIKIINDVCAAQRKEFCENLQLVIEGLPKGGAFPILGMFKNMTGNKRVEVCAKASSLVTARSSVRGRNFIISILKKAFILEEVVFDRVLDFESDPTVADIQNWLLSQVDKAFQDVDIRSSFDLDVILETKEELQISEDHPLTRAIIHLKEFEKARTRFNKLYKETAKEFSQEDLAYYTSWQRIISLSFVLPIEQRVTFLQATITICKEVKLKKMSYRFFLTIYLNLQNNPKEDLAFVEEISRMIREGLPSDFWLEFEGVRETIIDIASIIKGISIGEERGRLITALTSARDGKFSSKEIARICSLASSVITEDMGLSERVFCIKQIKRVVNIFPEPVFLSREYIKNCLEEILSLSSLPVYLGPVNISSIILGSYSDKMKNHLVVVREILQDYELLTSSKAQEHQLENSFPIKEFALEKVQILLDGILKELQNPCRGSDVLSKMRSIGHLHDEEFVDLAKDVLEFFCFLEGWGEEFSASKRAILESIKVWLNLQLEGIRKAQNNYAVLSDLEPLIQLHIAIEKFESKLSTEEVLLPAKNVILESAKVWLDEWLDKLKRPPAKKDGFLDLEYFQSFRNHTIWCKDFYEFLEKIGSGFSVTDSGFPAETFIKERLRNHVKHIIEEIEGYLVKSISDAGQCMFMDDVIKEHAMFGILKNDPLLDRVRYIKILGDKNVKKHPDAVKDKVLSLEKRKLNDREMAWILPTEYVEEEEVVVSPSRLQKSKDEAKEEEITYGELPPSVRLDTIDVLFQNLEAEINSLSEEEQQKIYKEIAYKTSSLYRGSKEPSFESLKKNFQDLKNGFTGEGQFISTLMHRSYTAQEKVPIYMARLYTIVAHILEQSSTGGTLNPRTELLLTMAASIQACSTGQGEGITLVYNLLKGDQENVIGEGAQRVLFYVAKSIQKMKKDLISSENALMCSLTGQLSVKQLSHQATYLENVIGSDIGSDGPYIPDIHSFCIADALLEKTKKQLLAAFYKECTPKKLLANVKNDINRVIQSSKTSSLYADIQDFLEEKKLSSLEGVWSVKEHLPYASLRSEMNSDFQEFLKGKKLENVEIDSREVALELLRFLKDKDPVLQDGSMWTWHDDCLVLSSGAKEDYLAFLMEHQKPERYVESWSSFKKGTSSFLEFVSYYKKELYKKELYSLGKDLLEINFSSSGLLKFAEFLLKYKLEKDNARLWHFQGSTLKLTHLGEVRFNVFVQEQIKERAKEEIWSLKTPEPTVALTDLGAFTLLKTAGYLIPAGPPLVEVLLWNSDD